MRPLIRNLENWIACDIFSKLSLFLYYFYNRLQYTKNAFVAVFRRFLEVFYALKESFKYFLQLVYTISSTYSSCLFERTVVQEVPMWIYGLFVITALKSRILTLPWQYGHPVFLTHWWPY